MSKALRFLQVTDEHQDCPFFTAFLTIKTFSQNKKIYILLRLHSEIAVVFLRGIRISQPCLQLKV